MAERLSVLLLLAAMVGCASRPVNPSFSVSENEAKKIIEWIEASPRALDRPVVVLAGWADPGFVNSYLVNQLERAGVPSDEVLGFKFIFKGDFDRCRDHVVGAVQAAWPSDEAGWTTEVDVVAFSMGGLVARYCAAPRLPGEADEPAGLEAEDVESKRRLKIRRLFTISTPHRGAALAWVPTFDRRVIDMRAGSGFLVHLDRVLPNAGYRLVPYTRLGDPVVGSERTAPAGIHPWWVDTPPLHRSHQEAYRDPRIRADILRRLRGETPLTTEPAAALPE
ncbi:MAG: hypothetical protein AAF086_06050 [Planctomycetota bacterium]